MTDTLKTLKDLETDLRPEGYFKSVDGTQLRVEAIKWVKAFRHRGNVWFEREFGGVYHPEQFEGWIKHFFNLTEEDLK